MAYNKTEQCYSCESFDNLISINKGAGRICRICHNKTQKRYRDKKRKQIFDHYGWSCVCCGESVVDFLTVDHVGGVVGEDRWSSGIRITGWMLYSRIIKAGYPDTYQTLCMNCNWGQRSNNGHCPHGVV